MHRAWQPRYKKRAQHVVIRQESYVAGTRERPEVGIFTQTHSSRPPVPWGKLSVGDLVWMKWSGGPIVAQARVQRFMEIENCTAEQLRQQTFGYRLYELDDYWAGHPTEGAVFRRRGVSGERAMVGSAAQSSGTLAWRELDRARDA